jgi:AraC-like DNA-binding protein
MATAMRVTGAWTQLLTDWLDTENLPAPQLRAVLDSRSAADIVPLTLWRSLLQQAIALRPERLAPGLEIGALIQPRHVGMLGYLILTCRTLGEAMLAYQRYESLFYGQNIVEIVQHGGLIVARWRGEDSTGELADSIAVAALISFLRRQVAEPLPPEQVSFAFVPPSAETQDKFTAFFDCPVQFEQPYTCVAFPARVMGIALPHSDPSMRSLLDRQAQAMLLALPDSGSFDRALQQAMVRLMPEAKATLAHLAEELHISVRTLQRRLAERHLTWRELLDRTREQLARHYLSDESLTLAEIALLLGFSEHSAFSRAYRQWTGTTPEKTRKLTKFS